MNRKTHIAVAIVALALAGSAAAAVSADEARALGTTLTPWGAEKAGNKEGTIPAYTGPVAAPASYDAKNPGYRPDPFAAEKPLFSIDAKNMDKYADKLSDGIKAAMKKYPTYRIDVYPSHRTANYPKWYLDNTMKNATGGCKTASDGLLITGCFGGLPFPIPKTGSEVMWNRQLKFDASSLMSPNMMGTVVDTQGNRTVTGVGSMWYQYDIFDPARTTVIGDQEVFQRLRIDYNEPARKAGEKLIVQDSIDNLNIGRRAWSYLPGMRRVKLAPDIAYDTPSPTGGGAGTVDEAAVFYGSLDRYDFKLVGKKELFIPYNDYKVRDRKQCPSTVSMSTKNHLNPDCVRWELHRVWEVKATLKPGKRHVYPNRTIYWDEDLPGVGISDNYDSTGQIFRVTHSLPLSFYETPGHSTDEWVTMDLATGNYARQEDVTDNGGWVVIPFKPKSFYASESLAGEGVR